MNESVSLARGGDQHRGGAKLRGGGHKMAAQARVNVRSLGHSSKSNVDQVGSLPDAVLRHGGPNLRGPSGTT